MATTSSTWPLGDFLRKLREEAGITSTHQIGKRGIVAQSYAWKVESGDPAGRDISWPKLRAWVADIGTQDDVARARELWMDEQDRRADGSDGVTQPLSHWPLDLHLCAA